MRPDTFKQMLVLEDAPAWPQGRLAPKLTSARPTASHPSKKSVHVRAARTVGHGCDQPQSARVGGPIDPPLLIRLHAGAQLLPDQRQRFRHAGPVAPER